MTLGADNDDDNDSVNKEPADNDNDDDREDNNNNPEDNYEDGDEFSWLSWDW